MDVWSHCLLVIPFRVDQIQKLLVAWAAVPVGIVDNSLLRQPAAF